MNAPENPLTPLLELGTRTDYKEQSNRPVLFFLIPPFILAVIFTTPQLLPLGARIIPVLIVSGIALGYIFYNPDVLNLRYYNKKHTNIHFHNRTTYTIPGSSVEYLLEPQTGTIYTLKQISCTDMNIIVHIHQFESTEPAQEWLDTNTTHSGEIETLCVKVGRVDYWPEEFTTVKFNHRISGSTSSVLTPPTRAKQ